MDSIAKFFKDLLVKEPDTINTFDDALERHTNVVNKLVDDIVNGFLNNTNPDSLLLELLDPVNCNNTTALLAKSIETDFKKLDSSKLGADIYIGKQKTKSCQDPATCLKNIEDQIIYKTESGTTITKAQVCNSVATYYIKLLNLLAALLIAISPTKNMCMERFNSLYRIITDEYNDQAFEISVCLPEGKRVTRNKLIEENGIRELINLYILDQIDKIQTPADIKYNEAELKALILALNQSGTLKTEIPLTETSIISEAAAKPKSGSRQPVKITQQQPIIPIPAPPINKATPHVPAPEVFTRSKSKKASSLPKLHSNSTGATSSSSGNSSLYSSGEYSSGNYSSLSSRQYSGTSNYPDSSSSKKSNRPGAGLEFNGNGTTKPSSNGISAISRTDESQEYSLNSYNNMEGGAEPKQPATGIYKLLDFIRKYRQPMSPEVKQHFEAIFASGLDTNVVVLDKMCTDSGFVGKKIVLDMADIYDSEILQDFLENFDKMKADYFNKCEQIITILKEDLMETMLDDSKRISYKFQQISDAGLQRLQSRCRQLLVSMYTKNHEYYLAGINILAAYYQSRLESAKLAK